MSTHRLSFVLCALLTLLSALTAAPAWAGEWQFTEVTAAAGVDYVHNVADPGDEEELVAGGVAAGDYDGDGWTDLYAVRGASGPNLLFRNLGDGTFAEVAAAAGLALSGSTGSGPTFADVDGDGWLDLLLGGLAGAQPRLFRNLGDGTFEETTASSGLFASDDTFSSAFGDYDRDGDLDIFLSHWLSTGIGSPHLWRNDGGGVFNPVDFIAGIAPTYTDLDYTFAPSFSDYDGDGWPDLLITGDFGTSQIFHNLRDSTFELATTPVISDENGMGSAIGDYDGDGDLDWFVSSIWDPDGKAEGNWGITGNRLYRNDGGVFVDATDEAGVRQGYWGWGSCFADFNLDGVLDLFHVNGFPIPQAVEYHEDPARLFIGNGNGTFTERGAELGVADSGQGRGIVCFDYDRDGDVDLFIANNNGPSVLLRNDLPAGPHYLRVLLRGAGANSEGIGAWVTITAGGRSQLREIRAGSNYVSQNPALAHFGLGTATVVDRLDVRWPSGLEEVQTGIAADQELVLVEGTLGGGVIIPTLGAGALALLALLLLTVGLLRVRALAVGAPRS